MQKHKKMKLSYDLTEDQECFIISPIGKEGTDVFERFKNVLEYIIRPAVKNSGYKLRVIRADDVDRAGSFIKDILYLVLNSFIVIADLTDQNPNVFYELGVRHSLSPRTILIAQDVSYIPTDLREYRTIIYEDSAKGTSVFQEKLCHYLEEIYDQPDRYDNPVLDRIGSVIEARNREYEKQINSLMDQLDKKVQKEPHKPEGELEHVLTRTRRIFKILKLDYPVLGNVLFDEGDDEVSIELETKEGKFELCFLFHEESHNIKEYWYIAKDNEKLIPERLLADVRILMPEYKKIFKNDDEALLKFIIITNDDLDQKKDDIFSTFNEMKKKANLPNDKNIILELWDRGFLRSKEQELGIYL